MSATWDDKKRSTRMTSSFFGIPASRAGMTSQEHWDGHPT
ncbi:hypothetical protein WwAna1739 [Wolbachia endosymbiont of Drosophila ananassae]|nr:hypothetical protein WwAna1739 [Wolbachia endosymbiont of Drosophila ananassae]